MKSAPQLRLWDGLPPTTRRAEREQVAGDAGLDADVVPLWLVRQQRRGVKSSTESLLFATDREPGA